MGWGGRKGLQKWGRLGQAYKSLEIKAREYWRTACESTSEVYGIKEAFPSSGTQQRKRLKLEAWYFWHGSSHWDTDGSPRRFFLPATVTLGRLIVRNKKIAKVAPDSTFFQARKNHASGFNSFFTTFSCFHSPHRSFLQVAPSSSLLLPLRPPFLLVVPLSSSSSTV